MDVATLNASRNNQSSVPIVRGRGRGRGRSRRGRSGRATVAVVEPDLAATGPPTATSEPLSENWRRPPPQGRGNSGRSRAPNNPESGHAPHTTDGGHAGPGPSTEGTRREYARPSRVYRRGVRFNAALTNASSLTTTSGRPSQNMPVIPEPECDGLASRLIRSLSKAPFIECPICFNAIRPEQATWSCSPTLPSADENTNVQCCWTTFHLRCVRSWATQSVGEVAEARRARGEEQRGEWRCPGCQTKRESVPTGYRCFCGSTPEPKVALLVTPHSCGNSCSRQRVCGHACPMHCHPGPCPPCPIPVERACHCGAQKKGIKCAEQDPSRLSCGNMCGKKLRCGNHRCERVCHEGSCVECQVFEEVLCYCGRSKKRVPCGEGHGKPCSVNGEMSWVGRFECERMCERPFSCTVHFCSKRCHPPSPTPPPCPRSPSLVTHCPCGTWLLAAIDNTPFFPPDAEFNRRQCTDPIPTCSATCRKPLPGCSHLCSSKCHTGPCPECTVVVARPCRCGAMTRELRCTSVQAQEEAEILCERACTALRACGRHQCNRVCCPLAALAPAKGKGWKRAAAAAQSALFDERGLHECDLVCGKLLGCGNHKCEERDHRGACPPCLRSSFEEMTCNCGLTVMEPPIPCGTRIHCPHQCLRDTPPCGHPRVPHTCHEDSTPCPPCVFLTSKRCACGKRDIPNLKCSQEKVFCGTACGKLLACGFHHCERSCHSDDCGSCALVCGKPRRLCLPSQHPCPLPCHAPSVCPESEPCGTPIEISCPCGRIKQAGRCRRCTATPSGSEVSAVKCTIECQIAKRNAKLADALGIDVEAREREKAVMYDEELISFAKINAKFLNLVEKTFGEFVAAQKKMQCLPPMPRERRKFVHDLASVYRMDTQSMDQEPHRSVQLIRRIDTRVPTPLLSSLCAPASANLGKLADMRQSQPPRRFPTLSTSPAATTARAGSGPMSLSWRAVVAGPASGRKADVSVSEERSDGVHVASAPKFSAVVAAHMPGHPEVSVRGSWEDEEEAVGP